MPSHFHSASHSSGLAKDVRRCRPTGRPRQRDRVWCRLCPHRRSDSAKLMLSGVQSPISRCARTAGFHPGGLGQGAGHQALADPHAKAAGDQFVEQKPRIGRQVCPCGKDRGATVCGGLPGQVAIDAASNRQGFYRRPCPRQAGSGRWFRPDRRPWHSFPRTAKAADPPLRRPIRAIRWW